MNTMHIYIVTLSLTYHVSFSKEYIISQISIVIQNTDSIVTQH